jgi:hypothetical protein
MKTLSILRFAIVLVLLVVCIQNTCAEGWVVPGFPVEDPRSYIIYNDSINDNFVTNDYIRYTASWSNPLFSYTTYLKVLSSDVAHDPVAVVRENYFVSQTPKDLMLDTAHPADWRVHRSDAGVIDNSVNSITYANQYGTVDGLFDLEYHYGTYNMEERLIIKDPSAVSICTENKTLTFPSKIRAYRIDNFTEGSGMHVSFKGFDIPENYNLSNMDSGLDLLDNKSQIVWSMQRPVIYNENISMLLNYSVQMLRLGDIEVDVHVPCNFFVNATYPVYLDPSWIRPTTVTSHTSELSSTYSAEKAIDGDNSTYWHETCSSGGGAQCGGGNDEGDGSGIYQGYGGETPLYEWGIVVDLADTYDSTAIRYKTLWGNSGGDACKVGLIMLCDDSACSGESDLISSDCGVNTDFQNCSYAKTKGRYLRVEGGTRDGVGDPHGSCNDKSTGTFEFNLRSLYELNLWGEVPVVALRSPADFNTTTNLAPSFQSNLTAMATSSLTLNVWNSTGSLVLSNSTSCTGTVCTKDMSVNFIKAGTYTWGATGCSDTSNCRSANRTITIKYAQGHTCANNGECSNSNCVDGVCCGTSSCPTCQVCNVTEYVGTCSNAPVGTDSHNDCAANFCGTGNCGTVDTLECTQQNTDATCSPCTCYSGQTSYVGTYNSTIGPVTNIYDDNDNTCTACAFGSTCTYYSNWTHPMNAGTDQEYFVNYCPRYDMGSGFCVGMGSACKTQNPFRIKVNVYPYGGGFIVSCWDGSTWDSFLDATGGSTHLYCDEYVEWTTDVTGCTWQTSGEGNCQACKTCDGATSTSCVNVANNNWDSQGTFQCTGTCIACESGSCTTTQNQTDPGDQCPTTQCNTGLCRTGGACDWYTSGERACSACKTCDGAVSTACVSMPNNQWDTQGGNTCTGTCIGCKSGFCDVADAGTNPGSNCTITGGCSTGLCKGGIAQCNWITSGEGGCAACSTCNNATSSSCVVMSDNTQDTQGSNVCNAACKKCSSGSCSNQLAEDLFDQCGVTGCSTGLCKGGAGVCDWYTSGERNCATCQTCDGASSIACLNFGNRTQDPQGSLLCDDTCRMCNGAGSCTYEPSGLDQFSQCADGVDCNSGTCNGAGNCGYVSTGQGACAACQTCNGTASTNCLDLPEHTQDTEGTNTCTSTCKECSGTGACVNQIINTDSFNQCGTVFCDDEASIPYYYGWISADCRYRSDVDSMNAFCSGAGSCFNDTYYCPNQPASVYTASSCYSGASIIDCNNQSIGKCAPFILSFTANDTEPYINPYGVGLVEFTMNVIGGTYSVDTVSFYYNNTIGSLISAYNGTNTMLWNVTGITPGTYSISGIVSDTQGNIDEYDYLTITIHNNTAPTVTANILGGGNETIDKQCEITANDIDPGQNISGTEYNWKINGTLINLNNENLSSSMFKPNDNITCLFRANDSYIWSDWAESTLLVIGDTIPPITYDFAVTPISFHTNEFGTMCFKVIDASGLDIYNSYVNLLDPNNITSSNAVSFDPGSGKYCYSLLSPTNTGTWIWTDVNVTDSAGNPSFNSTNIEFTVLPPEGPIIVAGGGGGGPKLDVPIIITPRDLVNDIPEPANLIGNKVKTYTVKPSNTGTFDIKFAFTKTVVTLEGKTVDATSFFKTIPANMFTLQNGIPQNISIYCEIPDEYAYPPWGVFNTTLVFAQSSKAVIQVNCESTAHSAGAGVLANILYETIPGLGIKVWEFLSLLVLVIFWRSMLVK